MKHEYPCIYKKFKCIGGSCPDSCCIGWEVDVDEESYYYYLTVKGKIGERIRKTMVSSDGETIFPLDKKGRCPFLNRKNLCDIIIGLGEDSLCTVCTEYPRYYEVAGAYEQIDMSLSCPEAARLFYADGERYEITFYDDNLADNDLPAYRARQRDSLINKRNAALSEIDGIDIDKCFDRLQKAFRKSDDIKETEVKDFRVFSALERETEPVFRQLLKRRHHRPEDERILARLGDDKFMSVLEELETLDKRWTEIHAFLKEHEHDMDSMVAGFLLENKEEGQKRIEWLLRTLKYFVYRYTIEAFFDKDINCEVLLIKSCMKLLIMMCAMRWFISNGHFDRSDMEDTAHIFSRQIEHSEENLEILKGRVTE